MSRRILRVFPRRTSYTPDDELVYIGAPALLLPLPEHDEVHTSRELSRLIMEGTDTI